jgi:excisionase family DNA binding protein
MSAYVVAEARTIFAADNGAPGGVMAGSRKESGSRLEPRAMLTMGEACGVLNVHSNTLRRWTETGLIKAYRFGLGGHRRYRQEDVVALLVEQESFGGGDVGD